ncbi:MAG: hypothetical protein NVS3B7_13650 [Candidatus Elarobacter sp.]
MQAYLLLDASPTEESTSECTPRVKRPIREYMPRLIRAAACVLAAALLCACSAGTTSTATATSSHSPAPVAPSTPLAVRPAGPANAPAPRPGRPGAIALDAAQRAELDHAVTAHPPAVRARLRYALAMTEDGKPHLVVYDGEGLPADGRNPGKPRDYTVFRVLNGPEGEHYDPQQNALIAPIPPPVQRDGILTR